MRNLTQKFDFDDILIIPNRKTNITSRYSGITLPTNIPLFTAPMDTVVNLKNIDSFLNNGISITLPRTIKYETFQKWMNSKRGINFYNKKITNKSNFENIFISLGFDDLDKYYKSNFKNFHQNAHILIDVANGHMQRIVDYAREIKRLRPDIIIMVGNIANPQTYYWYTQNQCVDYIRLGIGNGGGCLTTKQSGVGYPMASLIYETASIKKDLMKRNLYKHLPKIIADGGMKDYSDVIKALALGADYVMLGSLFNKTIESCAKNYLYGIRLNRLLAKFLFVHGSPIKKYFRGMSTKQAQKAMGKITLKTSEGVVRYRNVEYTLSGWVENFKHYLRNAMSYTDNREINDFIGNAKFCNITKSAYDRFNK